MNKPGLSVIVPVFNEERRVVPSIIRLARWLPRLRGGWELIVVDDGSEDRTPALLASLARRIPRLRLVRIPRNHGKGAAVRAGLREAWGKSVVFMDVDLSTPPTQIPAALRELARGADVAIGSRALPRSRLPVPQPLPRRLSGRAFNTAVRVICGLPFADTQCGFKAMTSRAARRLASGMREEGFAFDVELLLLARKLGLRVSEFPITWSDRAHSTVRLMGHSFGMFATLVGLRRRFRAEAGFHPVMALPLILTSVCFAVAGQVLMKHGANSLPQTGFGPGFLSAVATNQFVWGGLACYGTSGVTWLMALAKVDLSFAFPMLSLGFVATALYSWAYFGEVMSVNRTLGIALVVAGVFLIAASGAPQPQEGER